MNNKVFGFGIVGVLFFVIATILSGMQIPNYSHLSQLISESYAIGTPYGKQLRFFIFLPSGIFITAFAFFSIKCLQKLVLAQIGFFILGVFYGISTIIVSIFPCDEGCNPDMINPSIAQLIHNLTGMLTYMIVPISLIIIGVAATKWTKAKYVSIMGIILGLLAMLFVGILSANLRSNFAGLYQRIIESSILSFIIVCSFYFKNIEKVN